MGRKPVLFDLYSCAGGASVGYARAGFEVVGVDRKVPSSYPFTALEMDVLAIDPAFIRRFADAVHASPPCQRYTHLRHAPGTKDHDDLILPTLELLEEVGLPYVLENVEGAEALMPGAVTLCGTMFGLGAQGCELHRHRLFLANFPISAPGPCAHTGGPVIGCYGGHARRRSAKHGGRGTRDVWEGGHRAAMGEALGIDWATCAQMSEAIPPAYTEHLGRQMMAHLLQDR